MADIKVVERIVLSDAHVEIDGDRTDLRMGNWTFFMPAFGYKFLHARAARTLCLHATAKRYTDPSPEETEDNERQRASGEPVGIYTVEDWDRALTKSVFLRAAENYVAASRLADAGLGPPVSALAVCRHFEPFYGAEPTVTAGIVMADATALPAREPPTDGDVVSAQVTVDRLRSCVRQPLNGYIIDLNSVVGVMPVDAEHECQTLAGDLERALIG